LISPEAKQRVHDLVQSGIDEGANVIHCIYCFLSPPFPSLSPPFLPLSLLSSLSTKINVDGNYNTIIYSGYILCS
jgi:hypothetical protein